MTGQVPDAGPYIEQLDILVSASDHETFGIVLIEGMARGIPVVAVNSGGPREIVDDGRTGVLARSGEPQALADALEPLLASADLRRAMGQAGQKRFMQDFTDTAMRSRFYEQLERLGATSRPADAMQLDPQEATDAACRGKCGRHESALRGHDRRPPRRPGRWHGAHHHRTGDGPATARPCCDGDRLRV